MNLPNKCLVDTNVPKMANRALQSDDNISPEEHDCVQACIDASNMSSIMIAWSSITKIKIFMNT